MARDVEFDTVAHDKTAPGLSSTERRFRETQRRIQREQQKSNQEFTKGFLGAVQAVSPRLATQLSGVFQAAGTAAGPVLAGGVAAAAPLIGASISGAIIGGVGIGVAGIGVAIASQDVRVQAAADQLWSKFERRALKAAGVFVQPAIAGLGRLDKAADSIDLDRIFRDASRYVAPLVEGVSHFIESVGDGVEKLNAVAGPAVEIIANGIGLLGDEIERMFDSLSDNGIDAAVALKQVFDIAALAIRGVGMAINGLTEAYGFLVKLGLFGREAAVEYARLEANAKLAAGATQEVAGATGALGGILQTTEQSTESYADALKKSEENARNAAQANRDLFGATTSVGEAMDNARSAASRNGRTLDANTEKGRANRQALDQLAGALSRQYDATVAVNGVGQRSAQVAETNRRRFVQLAGQMGVSSGAANRLARSIGLVPTKREARIIAETKQAEARVKEVRSLLAQVRSKTVSVTVLVNESRRKKVENQLGRSGRDFADTGTWAGAAADGDRARTDAPSEISVESAVTVNLDGRPFRQMTARQINAHAKHQRWRDKVGSR